MIHRYSLKGTNIAIDSGSGSIHVLDDTAYEILGFMESCPERMLDLEPVEIAKNIDCSDLDEINGAYHELIELISSGMLFSEREHFTKPTIKRVVKALCLHVAHECNMLCEYCFAEKGGYGGRRSLMSLETGKAAIDFLIRSSEGRRNLEVDFFGGEPLINLDVVKNIVQYARGLEAVFDKEFRFTLTTNGLLLDDKVGAFLNAEMDNVVLSIDGRKEVNDLMRKKYNGKGSYDEIVPKYTRFVKNREGKYYVRGTYTRGNLDFAKDVLHLASLGFENISVEPVVADSGESYALTEKDLPVLFAEYELLAEEMLERDDFSFFHFNIDLTGGPCAAKRMGGCGAGVEYLAVTPEGDLYPCHQFVGLAEYKIGDLNSGITNLDKPAAFGDCDTSKPVCADCWCALYCGGGCAANAFYANGDIMRPYKLGCELQKKRTECAIMLKAAKQIKKGFAYGS